MGAWCSLLMGGLVISCASPPSIGSRTLSAIRRLVHTSHFQRGACGAMTQVLSRLTSTLFLTRIISPYLPIRLNGHVVVRLLCRFRRHLRRITRSRIGLLRPSFLVVFCILS